MKIQNITQKEHSEMRFDFAGYHGVKPSMLNLIILLHLQTSKIS